MQASVQQTSAATDVYATTAPAILNPPAAGRPSLYLESELESISTSSESTSTSESDPGKVISDFDAAVTTSMDYGWTHTPHGHGRGGRSIKSFQPSYVPSPLNRTHKAPVSPQPTEQNIPLRATVTVSTVNDHVLPEKREALDERSLTVTPRESQDLVQLPPIEPERIKKLVEAIASSINWTRALTDNEDNYKGEHDALLAILYMLTVRLNEGCTNRHVPLYRSLLKTIKALTKWCQGVISHRADWDWPLVSVTLRGYIQKLKDFQVSLGIDSDPNTIAARLNAQIIAHNTSRAETEAIRQAQKQKAREDKLARREARAEIRRMHAQFTAMKRAQMEGVELTELLGDVQRDEQPRSPPQIPDASMGSRSVHSDDDYVSNLQQALASRSSPGSKPSMSSLGSIIPRSRPTPRTTEQSATSRRSVSDAQSPTSRRGSPLLVPPGSPRPNVVPSSPRTGPADPYSKPLPHRPFSMSTFQASVPVKQPSHGGSPAVLVPQVMQDAESPPMSKSVGITSPVRSHTARVPAPPINVTPSAGSHHSASVTSDPPRPVSKDLPPAYQFSTTPGVNINTKEKDAEIEKGEKSSHSSDDDLVEAFNRVMNPPVRAATVPQASEHPNEKPKHEEYPDLTRSGSPPSSAKPYPPRTRDNQSSRKGSRSHGRGDQTSVEFERGSEKLRREMEELSEETEEGTQPNNGPDVLIRMFEAPHPRGIMEVIHHGRSQSGPEAIAAHRASSANDRDSVKWTEKASSVRRASRAKSKSRRVPTAV